MKPSCLRSTTSLRKVARTWAVERPRAELQQDLSLDGLAQGVVRPVERLRAHLELKPELQLQLEPVLELHL